MSADDKRIKILSDSEINELYDMPRFTDEQRDYYFDLQEDELELISKRDYTPTIKTYLILYFGYFKYKPIVLNPTAADVKADFDYIRKKYTFHTNIPKTPLDSPSKSRLYLIILNFLGYKLYREDTHNLLLFLRRILTQSAEPRELFDRCIQHLSEQKIAIPGYSTLQKIISSSINEEEVALHNKLLAIMTEANYQKLYKMANSEEDKPLITPIKQLPRNFLLKEISNEVAIFYQIKEVFPFVKNAIKSLGISNKNINYYGSMVNYYSITKLKRLSKASFSLYLICYLHQRYHQMGDILTNAFIYHVRKLTEEAKQHAHVKLLEDLLGIDKNIKKASVLLNMYADDDFDETPFGTIRKKAFEILPKNQITAVSNYLADIQTDVKKYQWDYYEVHHSRIKNTLRKLFLCLDFGSRDETSLLWQQSITTQQEIKALGRMATFDGRLIKPNLKPYLIGATESTSPGVNLPKAEMLLYQRVKDLIETGQFYLRDSFSYKRFEDDLVKPSRVKTLVETSQLASLKQDVHQLLADKEKILNAKLEEVSHKLTAGENPSVIFSDRKGKNKWTIKRPSKGTEHVNEFYQKLNPMHIGDIIELTQRNTQFSSALTHIRLKSNQSAPDLNAVIACVVANGTRYGIHNMATLCNLPYEQLRHTQKNYLRLETLNKVNDIISDAIAKLEIFKHYNIQQDILHASFDGQKLESRLSTIRTRFSSKYLGRGKGLSAVSLSANHVPINAKLMGLNEHESHYVFDLLYSNTSAIQPDVLSTDTHGTNQCNFALLDLSGWIFAPRYANPGKVLADLYICTQDENGYSLKMRRPINYKLIAEGWDLVQQIMVTLHSSEASQKAVVTKLSSYKKTSKLFQSLLEYDRLIKSIYMLDYMDDEKLRHYVHRALNRGESYHQLQRRIEQVNGSKFRGGSDDEINLWYECGRLISNCIIYFNSLLLSQLLVGYEKLQLTEKISDIKICSPVAWTHINFNGSYSFSFDGVKLDITQLVAQMMR